MASVLWKVHSPVGDGIILVGLMALSIPTIPVVLGRTMTAFLNYLLDQGSFSSGHARGGVFCHTCSFAKRKYMKIIWFWKFYKKTIPSKGDFYFKLLLLLYNCIQTSHFFLFINENLIYHVRLFDFMPRISYLIRQCLITSIFVKCDLQEKTMLGKLWWSNHHLNQDLILTHQELEGT